MVEVKLFNCPSYLGFRTVAFSEKDWFIFVGFLYLVRCLESRKFRESLGRSSIVVRSGKSRAMFIHFNNFYDTYVLI